ncbi:MAG: hypothetical protein IT545_02635 [Rhodobacteraceae bacterium]|nr:hypothetical protein [Paracoccaceae bacterium]
MRGPALALAVAVAVAGPAAAQPLSAIDWLTERAATPPPAAAIALAPAAEAIATLQLDPDRVDARGLWPAAAAGLPADLWAGSEARALVLALGREGADLPAAARDLLYRLLIVEAAPPQAGAGEDGAFLAARIDRLEAFGAIEPALALLEAAGTGPGDRFRRYFDLALLLDEEERACAALLLRRDLAAGLAARIFCLARAGDWTTATVALAAGAPLGMVGEGEADLLARFLDLPGAGARVALPPPARPSPLVWRLYEAIGEALPTATLPLAFAHADLESAAGWRAQIAAAERLYRSGAIPANQLIGIYTERSPAASGGVWERVAAVQRLEAALAAADGAALAEALPAAWDRLAEAGLEGLLPDLHGPRLAGLRPRGRAGTLAFRIALLSEGAAAAARARAPADEGEAFLIAVALGATGPFRPTDPLRLAVRDGLAAAAVPADAARARDDGRLGEALLAALGRLGAGAGGDPRGVGEGLSALVALGFEGVARRAALQLLLLGEAG